MSFPADLNETAQATGTAAPRADTNPTGQILGKFDIREKLADRDGVEILRARQTNVGRYVVVHLLRPEFSADPGRRAAFERDAKAKARLLHNRVAAVYEAGEIDGRPFFSCEYLGDSTLADLLAGGSRIGGPLGIQIIGLVADVLGHCEKENTPTAPIAADSIFLPNGALPRLANIACADPDPASNRALHLKNLGALILDALDASPASEPAMELARRLLDADSRPLGWDEVEELATIALTSDRRSPPPPPPPSAIPPGQPRSTLFTPPVLATIGATFAALAVVAAFVFLPPREIATTVPDLGALVEIPAGEFDFQGQPATLPAFRISKYEVTIAEYKKFLDDLERHPEKAAAVAHPDQPPGKSHVPKGWADTTDIDPPTPGYYHRAVRDGQYLGAPLTPDSPVFGIDWFDAYAYAKWLGRRLPTEQEWEKAARGPARSRHPWGDTDPQAEANLGFDFTPSPDAKAGGEKDGHKRWSRVDSPAADLSGYGVHGMAGNVSEWTSSHADTDQGSVPVQRGGNWMTGSANPGDTATATRRSALFNALHTSDTLGFRTAADQPQ